MAIDKLFQALVVGGISLGTQACAKQTEPSTSEPAPPQEETRNTRPESKQMEVNSKGEKCEDICYEQGPDEMICSEMCCWLMAVECCPNYLPPKEPTEDQTE